MARAKKEESNVVVVDTNSIKKEVMDYVDLEMDKRMAKFVNDQMKKEFVEEIEKANRKVIREKNRKIFWKNILLLLFFALICFLVYLLYTEHFFDSYFHPVEEKKETVVEKEEKKEEEVLPPTLEELKEEYASYLDPYQLSLSSLYMEDFYQGKLTDEMKNYFTLQSMDFDKLEKEEDYQEIDSSSFKEACSFLFPKDCKLVSFDYNGNKVRYFEKLESYVTNSLLEKEPSTITREIIDIQEKKNVVVITTVEGIVVDENLYSVSPYEWVSMYYGEGLSNYSDSLNQMIFTFQDAKLVRVEKG